MLDCRINKRHSEIFRGERGYRESNKPGNVALSNGRSVGKKFSQLFLATSLQEILQEMDNSRTMASQLVE